MNFIPSKKNKFETNKKEEINIFFIGLVSLASLAVYSFATWAMIAYFLATSARKNVVEILLFVTEGAFKFTSFTIVYGAIPLFLYAYVYRQFLIKRNTGYFGVSVISCMVVAFIYGLYGGITGMSIKRIEPMIFLGAIHAIPVAVTTHYISKKRRFGVA